MRITSDRYPIDIIFCIICSVVLLPLVILNINGILRILLGVPFIIFIPGYILISFLFPIKKIIGGLGDIERIAYSFGFSMAIVPIIGICLYYSPFGLRLESILLSLFIFNFIIGFFAIYRWHRTPTDKRYTVNFTFTIPQPTTKLDRILSVILISTLIITIFIIIFVVLSPRNEEALTEFYILGPTGKTTGYPNNLSRGENASVIIGLINHEHKTINYTIEVWLINQTLMYDESTKTNETIYHEMWFMNQLSISLNHFTENTEITWEPQWQYFYNFSINKTGKYALTFLLYTTKTQEYALKVNYKDIASQKIDNAYQSLYLWLNVKK